MSRSGQCPDCRTLYQFDVKDIGSIFECQCGLTLFAADIAGFSEIPVACNHCEGEYVVDRDGAGETVQCECGTQLTVPDLVLRKPLVQTGPQKHSSAGVLPEKDAPTPSSQTTDNADQNDTIENAHSLNVATNEPSESIHSASDEKAPRKPSRRKSRWSALHIGGILAVVLLLCFSTAMFVARRLGKSQPVARTETEPQPSIPVEDFAELAPITVSSGGPVDSGDPADIRSIATNTSNSSAANRSPRPAKTKTIRNFPPPAKRPLPEPKLARPLVPIPSLPQRGLTFDRAYQEAFESFERTRQLEKASEQSKSTEEYHRQLGTTIAMLQQATGRIGPQQSKKQLAELNYLLTYLYFRAGRLPEAAVLAEATARWGDNTKDATKEAALIGLAAMQEASQSHWGLAEQVGELDQMRTLIDVYAKRWPDDRQVHSMRLSLAQSYDRFNQPIKAVQIYQKTPKTSPHFATAKLAAGNALWTAFRQRVSEIPEDANDEAYKPLLPLRRQAKAAFQTGLKSIEGKGKTLTQTAATAKLNLVRIAISAGESDVAESLLVDPPFPLKDAIGIKKSPRILQVDSAFIRLVYETLFAIRFDRNDLVSAKDTLAEMSVKLGQDNSGQVAKLYLTIASDYIKQLSRATNISRKQLSTLSELIEPLQQQEAALTVANVLWLGESWSELAPLAETNDLSQMCYEKAAAAYELAMSRTDFPESSRQAASLRRLELVRKAGRQQEAYDAMTQLLQKVPNAFGMQIEAAQTLQELAASTGDARKLSDAIHGPKDSPVWGWSKLISVLHAQRVSDENQAKATERLMHCRYNLLWCHWHLAKATKDPATQQQRLQELQRMAARVKTTMKPGVEPWFSLFEQLLNQIESS